MRFAAALVLASCTSIPKSVLHEPIQKASIPSKSEYTQLSKLIDSWNTRTEGTGSAKDIAKDFDTALQLLQKIMHDGMNENFFHVYEKLSLKVIDTYNSTNYPEDNNNGILEEARQYLKKNQPTPYGIPLLVLLMPRLHLGAEAISSIDLGQPAKRSKEQERIDEIFAMMRAGGEYERRFVAFLETTWMIPIQEKDGMSRAQRTVLEYGAQLLHKKLNE